MIDLDTALREIRIGVLATLESYRDPDHFYHLATVSRETGLPREIVRATLRDLTDCGLTQFQRGLWTDGGEPAGSGYALTALGFAFLNEWRALTQRLTPPQGTNERI